MGKSGEKKLKKRRTVEQFVDCFEGNIKALEGGEGVGYRIYT